MSFTYFAIMEDLDKNVFFLSELGYTLIVDVDIDRFLIFKTKGIHPF